MDRFAFVDPETQQRLGKDAILNLYDWVQIDEELDLCDACIDDMLERKQLKCVWSLDDSFEPDEDFQ